MAPPGLSPGLPNGECPFKGSRVTDLGRRSSGVRDHMGIIDELTRVIRGLGVPLSY